MFIEYEFSNKDYLEFILKKYNELETPAGVI
jgi:hypothetical protein